MTNFQAFGSSWASQPNMPDRIRSVTISARSRKTASSCASKVTMIVISAMCYLHRKGSSSSRTLPHVLHPQLHHRSPATALILRGLGDRLHVRMLLQRLPQRFAEDAHTAARSEERRVGKECRS